MQKYLEKHRILKIKKKWNFEQKSLKNLKKHVIFINFQMLSSKIII